MINTNEARQSIEAALNRISESEWNSFLDAHPQLSDLIGSANEVVRESDYVVERSSRKPTRQMLDIFGDNLLSSGEEGQWVRYQLLVMLGSRKFSSLEEFFLGLSTPIERSRYKALRNPLTKREFVSRRWRRGSPWSIAFCEHMDLPASLAQARSRADTEDAIIDPVFALRPLHKFQLQVYKKQRKLLESGNGKAAMMSLPTGAGKTRVTVEAICDHLAEAGGGKPVLWVAQSAELQEQAWECFREVWQVPPQRGSGGIVRRTFPLSLVRLWGGRKVEDVTLPEENAVLIASIDQLASWVRRDDVDIVTRMAEVGFSCVVIDEAHTTLTNEFRSVLIELEIRAKKEWRMLENSAPLIGLSATPWRASDTQTRSLSKFFDRRLLKPRALGKLPIETLQQQGILSEVRYRKLRAKAIKPMTPRQRKRFDKFGELPADYLEALGREKHRNTLIINKLISLPKKRRTLVFACSVEHAQLLTLALNQAFGKRVAALLTAKTPRSIRHEIIEEFRQGSGIRFLCNVGVLVAGFDAPATDVVCITRPTCSTARYEQMVGRAMRGPLNGGTEKCLILDVQDRGLPDQVQSYTRVLDQWRG